MIKISVITPTLNAAKWLPTCLESVQSQDYPELEHIVVDGGSIDATCDLARSAPGVLLLERPGANQSRAINEGFRIAHGDVLSWLNADDQYTPGALRLVSEHFSGRPGLDALYGDCNAIDLSGSLVWSERPGPYDFNRLLRGGNYIAQPAVFFRGRLLLEIGYLDETFECGMDYELWLRLQGRTVEYVPYVLALFRWHAGSKTAGGQLVCWRELLRAVRRYGGGWTPILAWKFVRMLVATGPHDLWRAWRAK